MFMTKKRKIREYLSEKTDSDKCAFDNLLSDYLAGTLKENLTSVGIKKTEIHIDWLDDIKCIGVQGQYGTYYLDLQIYPNEFCLSLDLIEPDEGATYPLETKDQLYSILSDAVKSLK